MLTLNLGTPLARPYSSVSALIATTAWRLSAIEVHEFALGIGDARLLAPDRNLGLGQWRAFLARAQGHVTHGLEIGLDAVRVGLALLRQLHEEGRFPRLDAVTGHLLAYRHVDLGAGLLADLLREHALGVGDAQLLAVHDDLRLCRRLAVEARLDLYVEALAASAEQDGGKQHGEKTQVGCSHGDTLGYGVAYRGTADAPLTSRAPGY